MRTLTCLQLANSKIYRENFPPTQKFAKIMFLPDEFLNPLMELDPSLHWPHQVDVFWLLKCVILTFLAWDMWLKWLKSIEKLRVICLHTTCFSMVHWMWPMQWRGPTPSGGSGMHQEGTLFWQIFAWAGNFLGRSYCLQVANMLMFALTATLPINR